MEGSMKVAVMTDVAKVELTERPIPVPGEDEVLVRVEYVGVCGSDLHYYEAGGIGANIVKPPFVLGHEAGGTVVEVGAKVKHLRVGDRVALEPGKTCGHCEFCKTGKYNLCPDVIFFATPPVDGVFQEYVAHEADLCFKIPENMDTMEAALIEPLADVYKRQALIFLSFLFYPCGSLQILETNFSIKIRAAPTAEASYLYAAGLRKDISFR